MTSKTYSKIARQNACGVFLGPLDFSSHETMSAKRVYQQAPEPDSKRTTELGSQSQNQGFSQGCRGGVRVYDAWSREFRYSWDRVSVSRFQGTASQGSVGS